MEEIVNDMMKFGFTKMEAKTYIEILKNPGSNGYKLAKILEVPRSTVYSCLNNLYKRGAIYQITGKSKSYKAKDPKILFDEICNDYKSSANRIGDKLESLNYETDLDEYINIEGYENNISKVKEMIKNTKQELFINCGMKIDQLKNDLKDAKNRGVRVIIYTVYKNIGIDTDDYELYFNDKFDSNIKKARNLKIKVVSDVDSALIGSGTKEKFLGTYSENSYFISSISTYFHLDIYLNKLEEKYGKNLITEDIMLNSMHENKYKD